MAFFEQLGKKLSDAGQGAAQQAKIFSEVTKLNSSISEKERKINQLYVAIGQAYYAQHKDDTSAEEFEKIEEITNLNAEIAKCREDINRVKGIAKCPNCGAEVALGSAFCNSCGTKMPQPEPAQEPAAETVRLCPNCQNPVAAEDQFCTHCGTKMEGTPAPEAAEAAETAAPSENIE